MKEISAGGIVYRLSSGQLELLLIEDRFRKITFAKGRVEAGEALPETALREIEEETGIQGRITAPLGEVSYTYYDHTRGKIYKLVTYYLVEAIAGTPRPQIEEINKLRWCPLDEAELLHREAGYDNNKEILTRALSMLRQSNDS